ncbi:unnamed protein product [Choristocarpus tenellus]
MSQQFLSKYFRPAEIPGKTSRKTGATPPSSSPDNVNNEEAGKGKSTRGLNGKSGGKEKGKAKGKAKGQHLEEVKGGEESCMEEGVRQPNYDTAQANSDVESSCSRDVSVGGKRKIYSENSNDVRGKKNSDRKTSTWNCPRCTFRNDIYGGQCAMCGVKMPSVDSEKDRKPCPQYQEIQIDISEEDCVSSESSDLESKPPAKRSKYRLSQVSVHSSPCSSSSSGKKRNTSQTKSKASGGTKKSSPTIQGEVTVASSSTGGGSGSIATSKDHLLADSGSSKVHQDWN